MTTNGKVNFNKLLIDLINRNDKFYDTLIKFPTSINKVAYEKIRNQVATWIGKEKRSSLVEKSKNV